MKSIITSILIALIALPAAALDNNTGFWTGGKKVENGKLLCDFRVAQYEGSNDNLVEFNKWLTSMDNGKSPICPVDVIYNWMDWRVDSYDYWDWWKTTTDWTRYKQVQEVEKQLDHGYSFILIYDVRGDFVYVDRDDYLDYMARVRLGMAESYVNFLNRYVKSGTNMSGLTDAEIAVYRAEANVAEYAHMRYMHLQKDN